MKPTPLHVANGRPLPRDATPAAGPSFQLGDIAYILFRHKWKIIICSLLGFIAAGVVWFTFTPKYISTASLLIRYVLESRDTGALEEGSQIMSPDSRGDAIISSEIEMLMSLDLAEEVAKSIGATNILAGFGGGDSDIEAAAYIQKNLEVKVRPKSNVIGVSFEHPDPKVAREVVTTLISRYLKMHARIHRALDVLDDLARQADQKRGLVEQTEGQLRAIKTELGIVSVAEAQKSISDLVSRLRTEILSAEAELAEGRAAFARITNSTPLPATPSTNEAPITPPIAISPDLTKAYQSVVGRLESLQKREQELLLQFTPTSSFVTKVSSQIKETLTERDRLVAANPGLTNTPIASLTPPGKTTVSGKTVDPTAEMARIDALEAKLKVLREQWEEKKQEALKIADKESEIAGLERKLAITEKQYTYYSTSLEQARVDDAVSNSRLSNISVVQSASPAGRDISRLKKILLGAVFGGIGLGLGLAFLIEFFTDQSIRRPKQVTDALHLPLFMSLPKMVPPPSPATNPNGSPSPEAATTQNELAKCSEALRDRLIMHFQIKELHHKPKLIGVTSCGHGAGVTTIASNLAASLSETGEGNVLYVDVNQRLGPSVHPFHKGKEVVEASKALNAGTRDSAQVSDNLYMVSLTDPNNRKVGVLPKRIANLVADIKTSDYDYIIFDLPPVTQTSATPRVTGLFDMTVVVLESEKTHNELARQAVSLMAETNTEMVAVLNKHRRYLPRKLDSDL
ncbi:MAG: P-loop NTPase [Verrucomicrobia bacterium]|nr:P-loop NTPase [Verrucomicrobiota bacterium]